jgi:tetratricopeptide (TPR) repeat protein
MKSSSRLLVLLSLLLVARVHLAAAQPAPDAETSRKAGILELVKQGFAREDAGDLKGAIGIYQKILVLDPKSVAAMTSIAGLHGKLGEAEQELAWTDKAIAINPRFQHAYINRGNALMALGRLDDAKAAYEKAVALDPKDPIAVYSLGVLAEQRKDFAAAVGFYARSVELDPKFENGYFNLAVAHANLGHWDDAIAAMKKTLEINPDAEDAKAMLPRLEDASRKANGGGP